MLYTAMTKQALQICYQAHSGQTDRGGTPYAFHPLHLAEQMHTEDEICVALLHDVIEDTPYTIADLQRLGFSPSILNALQTLTRHSDVPYMQYISTLRANSLAKRVKQADLKHNMDLKRLNVITRRDQRCQRKYRIALAILADDTWNEQYQAFCKPIPFDEKQCCILSVFYQKNTPDEPARVLQIQITFETKPKSIYPLSLSEIKQLALYLRHKLAHTDNDESARVYDTMSFPELLTEYLAIHSDQILEDCLYQLKKKP